MKQNNDIRLLSTIYFEGWVKSLYMFELREIDLTNTWNIRNIRNCSPGPGTALGEKREEVWALSPPQTTALFDPVNGFLTFSESLCGARSQAKGVEKGKPELPEGKNKSAEFRSHNLMRLRYVAFTNELSNRLGLSRPTQWWIFWGFRAIKSNKRICKLGHMTFGDHLARKNLF